MHKSVILQQGIRFMLLVSIVSNYKDCWWYRYFSPLTLAASLLGLLLIIAAVTSQDIRNQLIKTFRERTTLFFLAYLLVVTLTLPWNKNYVQVVWASGIIFIAMHSCITTRQQLIPVLWASICALGIGTGLAWGQILFHAPYPVKPASWAFLTAAQKGMGDTIIIGLYTHPNCLAQALMLIVPTLWLGLWSYRKNTRQLPWWAGLCLFFSVPFFYTLSRGAIFFSILAVLLFYLLRYVSAKKRDAYRWPLDKFFYGSLIISSLIMAFSVNLLHSPTPIRPFEKLNLYGRRSIGIEQTFRIIKDHPECLLRGAGILHWPTYSADDCHIPPRYKAYCLLLLSDRTLPSAGVYVTRTTDAHNLYLNQLLFFGLLGVIFFCGIISSSLQNNTLPVAAPLLFSPIPYALSLLAAINYYFYEPALTDGGGSRLAFFFILIAILATTKKDLR